MAGTPAIEQALEKLNVVGSVLMIAAHPDDENNVILAWFARGRHYRTAYLSATRGEGGQNLIGPEQGELLGLIRTQELLAARRVDGAGQFFTRAIDFGFTKSAEETFQKWGHDRVLADLVWVIRSYRPDVLTMSFSGTPRDGHGQHQASGILAKEAFSAAADPARFPEQLRYVQPWQAKRLVHHPFFAQGGAPVTIDGGEFNPVLGRSYAEIAGLSRSMHKSQGMGAAQPKGPSPRGFVTVAGEPARGDVFDGIDTTWNRLPGGAAVRRILFAAVAAFDPRAPDKTIPALLEARPLIAAIRDPWGPIKVAELDETVALLSGLWVDAAADRYGATPGSRLSVRITALNRSNFPLALEGVDLEGMGARTVESAGGAPLAYNRAFSRELTRQVPGGQRYSQPYWLAKPRTGDTYEVDDQRLVGLPENPPELQARFHVLAGGQRLELLRPVRYRYVDHVLGELTRAIVVVPPVAVNLPQDVLVFPSGAAKQLPVEVQSNSADSTGEVRIEAASGWSAAPVSHGYAAAQAGGQHGLEFQVTPPAVAAAATVHAEATVAGGAVRVGMHVIQYPHIPPQTYFPPAEARLVRADIRVTARRVGYVMGAGDEMPEALRQLGCDVVPLTASDLEQGNLSYFDAIVTGVRAYNVRADLRANQPRLLEYVNQGGTLIVQYNVTDSSLAGVNLGPYPITIGRERVTVEEAPVAFPDPQSPLLKAPNLIGESDFAGWVQERGLYFASSWDPRYRVVMECHDPGEKGLAGGELWTRYGKGVYIFTAYSWFRQLPAGVPGAYRLFANLLSAK